MRLTNVAPAGAVAASAARPQAAWWPGMQSLSRPAAELWWLHPVACVAMMALVYATFMGFEFERVVPHAYIPGLHYAWGGALLAALALGAAVAVALQRDRALPPSLPFVVPGWAMAALLGASVLAYAVWFQPLIQDPGMLLEILSGRRANVRDVAPTLPGVTTMTQFGVAYLIAYAAMRASHARRLAVWERAGVALIFVLGAIRMVAWSERLAVIELVVTYAVARLAFAQVASPRVWSLAAALPLAAPLLLYGAFTGTEYFRSWEFFRNQYDSIWAFSLDRLLAYYATASNNGIGLLVENPHWPEYSGRWIAEWLYMMPFVGEALREAVGDSKTEYYQFLLGGLGRAEFNNPSGLFPVVFDIGYAGSMLYFLAAGAVAGTLYDGWRRHAVAGVLFYPPAVLFLLEILRFNYFASTRFFPVAVALAFLWAVSRPAPLVPAYPAQGPSW